MYYDLKKLAKECIGELEAINIHVTNVTPNDFSINTRAKSRYGQCRYTPNGYKNGKRTYKCTINISSFLLDNRNDVNSVKGTIMHELLHSLDDCIGNSHGAIWQGYAERVNKVYGYGITRTSAMEDRVCKEIRKEISDSKVKKHKRVEAICKDCGRSIALVYRQRLPKWAINPNSYHCGYCGESSKGHLIICVNGKVYHEPCSWNMK